MESVGAFLGNGVDQSSSEPPLANVEWGNQDLVFTNRFHRDRLGICLAARRSTACETKEVVVHAAVDLNVVEAVVLPANRRCSARIGDDLGNRRDEVRKV